jgi:glycosyltransferase involved in cell wall biosynthesis
VLLRWFAPNRFCTLVVPALERAGLRVAVEGDERPDLVVAMDGQRAVPAFELARRHRRPLLLYLWDLPPWRLGTGQPDVVFELGGRVRRVPRVIGGYRERSGYYSRLRFIARRAEWVWAPSTLTVEDLGRRFGVTAELVPYCYDSDRFRPAPWAASRPARLFSVSRLTPHKNHAAVIRAAAGFAPRCPVHVIGEGGEGTALRSLAESLDVPFKLDDGGVGDSTVDDAYRAATVVVAPSRFEGFGLTPMEAVATGRPAVASDIPPHREHIGDAAVYFELESDASLREAIVRAISRGPVDPGQIGHLTIEAAAARFLVRLEAIQRAL